MVGHLFVVGSACVLTGGLLHDWLIIIVFHGLSQVMSCVWKISLGRPATSNVSYKSLLSRNLVERENARVSDYV